jgi:integrase
VLSPRASQSDSEGRRCKFVYGKTRKEVQEKLHAALQERQQGMVLTETARQTVSQFLADWLANSQKQSVRPRTYERYEEVVRLHNVPVLGHHRMQKLSTQHLARHPRAFARFGETGRTDAPMPAH